MVVFSSSATVRSALGLISSRSSGIASPDSIDRPGGARRQPFLGAPDRLQLAAEILDATLVDLDLVQVGAVGVGVAQTANLVLEALAFACKEFGRAGVVHRVSLSLGAVVSLDCRDAGAAPPTFTGGSGHLGPLVPIAHAAQAAGQHVAIAGRPSLVDEIEALGFTAFAPESGSSELPSERIPLQPLDTERELRAMVQGFAASIARDRAPRVLELCEQWRPDVIVREEFDFGTAVAAERLGMPDATVLVSASGAFPRPAEIGEALQEVRADHGLAPDPGLGR